MKEVIAFASYFYFVCASYSQCFEADICCEFLQDEYLLCYYGNTRCFHISVMRMRERIEYLQKARRESPVIDPGDEAPFLVCEVRGKYQAA